MSVKTVDRRVSADEFNRVSDLPVLMTTKEMLDLSSRVKSFCDVVDKEGVYAAVERFGDPDSMLAVAITHIYGGKGLGLIKSTALAKKVEALIREKYGEDIRVEVPKFELIGERFFDEFVQHNNGVLEKLEEIKHDRRLTYEERRELMISIVDECTLSEKNKREINTKYGRIGGEVMVRSTATCEDSSKKSYAGKFESYPAGSDSQGVEENMPLVELNILTILQRFLLERALDPSIGDKEKMNIIIQKRIKPDVSGIAFSTLPESLQSDRVLTHLEVVLGSPETAVRGNSSTMLSVGFEDGKFRVYEILYGFPELPENIDYKDMEKPIKRDEYIAWKRRLWNEKTHNVLEEDSGSVRRSPISLDDARRVSIVSRAYAELLGYISDMEFGITDGVVQCWQNREVTGLDDIKVDVSDLERFERQGILKPIIKTPICIGMGRCKAPLVYFDERYDRQNIKRLDNEALGLESSGDAEGARRLREEAKILRDNIHKVNSRFSETGYILAIPEAARTVGPESDELFSNRLALVDPLYGSRTAHGAIQTREWCKGNPKRFYIACPSHLDELKKYMDADPGIPGVWISRKPFIAYSLGLEGDLIPTEGIETLPRAA